jgi:ribosomal protein S18 acetylase RimI-like enzyme
MADIEIVKLNPQEWQPYKQLRLEMLQAEPQAFGSRYDEMLQKSDDYWQGRLEEAQAGKNWMLFARSGERLVGMIGAFRAEQLGVVRIISVYVSAAARGQGVGGALMEAILDEVGRKGEFHTAVLGVTASQAAAVALYRRYGFQIVSEEPGVMGDGQEHLGYEMEKILIER